MIAFILLEVMSVGGGKVETLSNLADFVERVNQLEKEKNSSLRLYGIIPYFGAIISILTLIIMLDVFMNPVGNFENSLSMSDKNKDLLLTGSIIQAFTTGIVAGKMGEGSVAAGFKHALILTIISLVSIFTAPMLTSIFDI
jgi:flagellar protein FlaJ